MKRPQPEVSTAAKGNGTSSRRRPDASIIREIAVAAQVDPRTVCRVLDGVNVRGMAGRRARDALLRAGYLTAPNSLTEDS